MTAGPPTDELGRPVADQERLLAALVEHEVEFLVAGGVAVIAHGYVRLTRDVDVIPSPDAANMRRLAATLRDLDASAVGPRGERLPLDLSHPESLAVSNYFLTTRAGALDLFNGPRPDLHRYRRLAGNAVEVQLGDRTIKIVGKDDLIDMKREAGRPKDLADIAALTEIERRGGDR
jgi:hypothetical protein